MRKYAVFALFLAFALSDILGVNLSLVPGLSVKNALLYVLVVWIVLDGALLPGGEGVLGRLHDYVPLHFAFVLLAALATLSVVIVLLFVKHPGYSLVYGIQSLKTFVIDPYLVLFVFLAGVSNPQDAKWLVKAMLVTMVMGCALCLVDMFRLWPLHIMSPREDGRLQGPLGVSNDYGTLMAFLLPLAAAMLYASKGFARLMWAGAMMILMLVLLFSVSRGGVAGLVGGGIVGAMLLRRYLSGRQVVRFVTAFSLLALIGVGILAVEYSDLLYERFVRTIVQSSNAFGVSSGRTEIWAGALRLMMDAPLTPAVGFGWRSFDLLNPAASHNEYLEYFFDLGLIGLVTLLYIYAFVVRQSIAGIAGAEPETRALLMGLVFGFLGVVVANLFGNLISTALFIWAFSGVILRMARPVAAGVFHDALAKEPRKEASSPLRVR